jgi:hypothetical protein
VRALVTDVSASHRWRPVGKKSARRRRTVRSVWPVPFLYVLSCQRRSNSLTKPTLNQPEASTPSEQMQIERTRAISKSLNPIFLALSGPCDRAETVLVLCPLFVEMFPPPSLPPSPPLGIPPTATSAAGYPPRSTTHPCSRRPPQQGTRKSKTRPWTAGCIKVNNTTNKM